MASIDKESLFEGSNVSLINTRQQRYNNIRFSGELSDNKTEYILTSEQGKLSLSIKDEIVLYIIAKFRFCPSWLARQWYEESSDNIAMVGEDVGRTKLRSFIDFGLIYEFPSAVAVFLMPTDRLASLFGVKLGSFNNPPYNTLTHTISEEQVMYECLSGNAKYLSNTKCIPYVSSLGLGSIGAACFPESDYSVRSSFFQKHIEEFNDQEARLAQEILQGKIITTVDFKESKFTIHKKIDQYEYNMKIPDLAVLAPRVISDGLALPMSVALEVELTCKGVEKYERLLDLYWSNLKFGTVVYLVNQKKTRDCLIEAYRNVQEKHAADGEEQVCKVKLVEFEVPYNKEQMIES